MRIFIDIDGVLARPDESAIARLCNDEWRLGIEEERLIQIKELNDFKAMPEVIARCGERDDTTFEFELGWMRFKPQAIRADIVLAGAVSGVRHLSRIAQRAIPAVRRGRRTSVPRRSSGLKNRHS